MNRAWVAALFLALGASVAVGQPLGGTHQETGQVLGAFSGGIFNFLIPHPYTPDCGLQKVTLFLSMGDTTHPVPVECGPVLACQCWGLQAGTVVTVSGRIVGNGYRPGDVEIAPTLHVGKITAQ